MGWSIGPSPACAGRLVVSAHPAAMDDRDGILEGLKRES